jgi:hypothetical protein
VHSELFGGFALVALVVGEYLDEVTAFELPERVRIGDASRVHLSDEGIEFALQIVPHPAACRGCEKKSIR